MSGGINWPIMIVFVLPLACGTVAFLVASRFRGKWARIAARVVGSAFILAFLAAAAEFTPYLWACHLESKWSAANPETKAQLEACLSLYSKHEIQPSQSAWGRNLYPQLGPGERMTQYRLLYRAPLDVVYRSNDTIVVMLTSYE